MTKPIIMPPGTSSISIQDMLAELAIRQFEGDSNERWIEAAWPMRGPEASVRRALEPISERDLATYLLDFKGAVPKSILTFPGEKFEDQNDLKEVHTMTTEAQRRAREATVGIVRERAVKRLGGEYSFSTDTFRGCAGESFAGQPRGPNATGVLVGQRLILTAGHYVVGRDARSMYFFFDYFLDPEGRAPERFPRSAVYRGEKVVAIHHRPVAGGAPLGDWALVMLDREVEGRRPLAVRRTGKIAAGRPLFMVGHPAGFPMKYALDGAVVGNEERHLFLTTLDMIAGGSGSPVFDAEAEEPLIEGIVSQCGDGFMSAPEGQVCTRYFRTEDIVRHGTRCARTTEFADAIPELA